MRSNDPLSRRPSRNEGETGWHMRQAFRRSWDAAEQGLDREQAQARVDQSRRLNRMTTPAWWRGYDTCRNETSGQ